MNEYEIRSGAKRVYTGLLNSLEKFQTIEDRWGEGEKPPQVDVTGPIGMMIEITRSRSGDAYVKGLDDAASDIRKVTRQLESLRDSVQDEIKKIIDQLKQQEKKHTSRQ